MSSFNELLQSYVNRDYDDLVDLARSAVDDLMPMLQRTQTEVNAGVLVYSAIMAAVAADGKLTPLENKFLRDVLSFTDEEINIMLNKSFGFKHCIALHFEIATPRRSTSHNISFSASGKFHLCLGFFSPHKGHSPL